MMMKRILPFILLWAFCTSISLADYADGFITSGEYEYGVIWTSSTPPLIVEGGGADIIEMGNYGRLEVRSTSSPLGLDVGGIFDINLLGNSHLDYLGGKNELITIFTNATADLRGGSINYIKSLQYSWTSADSHIDLYCQPGWSWMSNDPLLGIEGLWQNSSPFSIEFINDEDYTPVWTNINVVEIPEPATLTLLGLGGLLLKRKR